MTISTLSQNSTTVKPKVDIFGPFIVFIFHLLLVFIIALSLGDQVTLLVVNLVGVWLAIRVSCILLNILKQVFSIQEVSRIQQVRSMWSWSLWIILWSAVAAINLLAHIRPSSLMLPWLVPLCHWLRLRLVIDRLLLLCLTTLLLTLVDLVHEIIWVPTSLCYDSSMRWHSLIVADRVILLCVFLCYDWESGLSSLIIAWGLCLLMMRFDLRWGLVIFAVVVEWFFISPWLLVPCMITTPIIDAVRHSLAVSLVELCRGSTSSTKVDLAWDPSNIALSRRWGEAITFEFLILQKCLLI